MYVQQFPEKEKDINKAKIKFKKDNLPYWMLLITAMENKNMRKYYLILTNCTKFLTIIMSSFDENVKQVFLFFFFIEG